MLTLSGNARFMVVIIGMLWLWPTSSFANRVDDHVVVSYTVQDATGGRPEIHFVIRNPSLSWATYTLAPVLFINGVEVCESRPGSRDADVVAQHGVLLAGDIPPRSWGHRALVGKWIGIGFGCDLKVDVWVASDSQEYKQRLTVPVRSGGAAWVRMGRANRPKVATSVQVDSVEVESTHQLDIPGLVRSPSSQVVPLVVTVLAESHDQQPMALAIVDRGIHCKSGRARWSLMSPVLQGLESGPAAVPGKSWAAFTHAVELLTPPDRTSCEVWFDVAYLNDVREWQELSRVSSSLKPVGKVVDVW